MQHIKHEIRFHVHFLRPAKSVRAHPAAVVPVRSGTPRGAD
jgi:hypothetical protein